MNLKDVKEYLLKAQYYKLQIEDIKQQIKSLRELSVSESLSDYEQRQDALLNRYISALDQISEVISRVPNQTERLLLCNYYIDGLKFKEIAQKMNYSERQVLRIHKSALQSVQLILNSSSVTDKR